MITYIYVCVCIYDIKYQIFCIIYVILYIHIDEGVHTNNYDKNFHTNDLVDSSGSYLFLFIQNPFFS